MHIKGWPSAEKGFSNQVNMMTCSMDNHQPLFSTTFVITQWNSGQSGPGSRHGGDAWTQKHRLLLTKTDWMWSLVSHCGCGWVYKYIHPPSLMALLPACHALDCFSSAMPFRHVGMLWSQVIMDWNLYKQKLKWTFLPLACEYWLFCPNNEKIIKTLWSIPPHGCLVHELAP